MHTYDCHLNSSCIQQEKTFSSFNISLLFMTISSKIPNNSNMKYNKKCPKNDKELKTNSVLEKLSFHLRGYNYMILFL